MSELTEEDKKILTALFKIAYNTIDSMHYSGFDIDNWKENIFIDGNRIYSIAEKLGLDI